MDQLIERSQLHQCPLRFKGIASPGECGNVEAVQEGKKIVLTRRLMRLLALISITAALYEGYNGFNFYGV
ncbi:uncharacterized protein PADG_11877 [Paracoccidioides brasiliensis Pb18]|uniref:Uncharacterized protein n=1 Tax=Paracoccidioides brasiliensis (strain Pb18) TaxID=502780 RepID=A0A0A0HVL3_PARBD|nr:uncharacterized protein PADG_11877 [Paracoccidioides brasiliensis Pb18]KGM92081.1 hypothetical protein PADG_11877 [Paracoccidioides brasiliensis Pb18]